MYSDLVLLTAAAAHLGFQLAVSGVVYPALAREPAERWSEVHRAHSRRITPVVIAVYGLLAVGCGWALLSGPGFWTLIAVGASAFAALVTAAGAAPTHSRLGAGWNRPLIERLLVVDRLRTAGAAAGTVAAFLAAR